MKRLILIAVAISAPGAAQSFTDLSAIDREVSAFVGGPAGGAAMPVDRRLRLARCTAPLSLGWYGQRRDTVQVQCLDPSGWRVFVPIVSASTSQPSAVLRGETVTVAVEGSGFSVSQAGEALEAGAVGAWIRVKTISATQPLRAQILRPGLVAIDLAGNLP